MRVLSLALLLLALALPSEVLAWSNPICNPHTGEVLQPGQFADEQSYNAYLSTHPGSFQMAPGDVCHTPPTPDLTPTPTATPTVTPTPSSAAVTGSAPAATPTPTVRPAPSIAHFVAVCEWEATPSGGQWNLVHREASLMHPLPSEQSRTGVEAYLPNDSTCGPQGMPTPSLVAVVSTEVSTQTPSESTPACSCAVQEVTLAPTEEAMAAPSVEVEAAAVPAETIAPEAVAAPVQIPLALPVTGDGSCAEGCEP